MAKLTALVSLTLIVLLGLVSPVSAEPATADWFEVELPREGKAGGWQLAPGSDIGNLSLAIDDTLYATRVETTTRLMKSSDGGLSWSETGYAGAVVDIVCSRLDAATIYLNDGRYIQKSDDGGESFHRLSENTLPNFTANETISCFDVGYDGNSPVLFIGTADSDPGQWGGIYYLPEGYFGVGWTDMEAGNYDIYTIACAPQFARDSRLIALASDEAHSYVINNYGIIGDWLPRIELLNGNTTAFRAEGAARIGFFDDFDSVAEFFVAVSANGHGGVYRVYESSAYDQGPEADIHSLALGGDDRLLAGGGDGRVWYSADRGNSWHLSQKPPTGNGAVSVAFAAGGDTAYVATGGHESAFSLSRDGGLTWNQTSLIDTEIDDIVDLSPSPGYGEDGTLFMLSYCATGSEHSLWRRLDGVWERVYSGALPEVVSLKMVALSPLYSADSQVVLLAGTTNSYPAIWKSTDNGQGFSLRRTPFSIDAWAIVDDGSWFIGGFDGSHGLVRFTENSGLTYSAGTVVGDRPLKSIALSPDYGQDGTLLAGNDDGWVFWSEDNGQSFELLGEPLPELITAALVVNELTVAFDPGYSTNKTVYAASHCYELDDASAIYRFIIGRSEDWEAIDTLADGELVQIAVSAEGTLYAANFDVDGGMERCLNPTFPLTPTFESVSEGLEAGATLKGLWLCGHQLWSIDDAHTKLMSYLDSLTAPVSLTSPPDGAPGVGLPTDGTVTSISLDWETLEGATEYQWQLNYEADFSSLPVGFEDTTASTTVHLPELEIGTSYYWRVRAIKPVLSPWSETWSFTTSLGQTVNAPDLYSPEGGAEGVTVKPIFQWSPISGADGYELMVSTYATFDNPTILKTAEYILPTTAWQCNISLNHDTTYYWKVRAVSADSYSAWSAVSAFSTEPAPNLQSGMVAEVPPNSDSGWPDWLEWLMPVGGIVLLVFLVVMVLMVIVMVVLVVKVSKL